jgi:ABC-type multidrug transport system fused ATPase/permease subunit
MTGSPWRFLSSLMRPQWRALAVFGAVLAAATAIPLATSLLLSRFVRLAVKDAPGSQLAKLAIAYTVLGFLASGMTILVTWRATIAAWSITNSLRHDLAEYVLKADLGFHRDRTPGELVTRVDADITSMTEFMATVVAQIIAIAAVGIGAVLVSLIVEPVLAPALAVALVGVGFVTYRVREKSVEQTVAERAADADVMSAIEQYLSGADDIAALGAGKHGVARVGERSGVMVAASRARVKAQMSMQGIIRMAVASAEVWMIGYGAFAFQRGWLDVGSIVLGFRLVMVVAGKVDHLTWRLQDAQGASGAARRVLELVQEQRVLVSGLALLPAGPLGVSFENVQLVYDDEEGTNAAIEHLSLLLPAGRVLGVVGRTGSGKTSLARLLLRLVAPTSGTIRMGSFGSSPEQAFGDQALGDGALSNDVPANRALNDRAFGDHPSVNEAFADGQGYGQGFSDPSDQAHVDSAFVDEAFVREAFVDGRSVSGPLDRGASADTRSVDSASVDDAHFRKRVTAIPQDVQLFPGTVRDNVTLFAPFADERVQAALRDVGLSDWLDGLAAGLDTPLASDSRDNEGTRVGLSSGQAQLLALSRALLREPSVVVLDEATSRVDPATQLAIGNAIARLVSGRTALVIAHRLETLDICDDILVLSHGRLVEHGPRLALAADPTSHYARLRAAGAESEELA